MPAGPPREILHSPLRRTAETATAIRDAISEPAVPLVPDPGIREIDQGAWEGMRGADIAERYGAELAAWRRTPTTAWAPGGESLADVRARVRPALAGLLDRLGAGRPSGSHDRPQVAGYHGTALAADQPWAVVVGHDGVFKVAFLSLFDLPLERFWSISFPLCGLTVIELRAGRPVLRAHGLVDHLAALDAEPRVEASAAERSRNGAL